MFFFYFFIFILSTFFLVILVSIVLTGVPCLPTHTKQALKMIELSGLKAGDRAVELGAGHGRLLFLLAKSGVQVDGYELNPLLFLFVWLKILITKQTNARIFLKSIYVADLKNVDTAFCFLFTGAMKKLSAKLFSEMKPGSRIVSYVFSIPNKEYIKKEEGIFVYKI